MYFYMINKHPIGEYYRAFEHSLKSFQAKDPKEMAAKSGVLYKPAESAFYMKSLTEEIRISYTSGEVTFVEKSLPPLWEWQLIILNYLSRAGGQEPTGTYKTYRDMEAGNVFYPAFKKNSIDHITAQLGCVNEDILVQALKDLGGSVENRSKITATFQFLPRFPVTIQFWPADDELPASANIIFDSTANDYLHTEDIAVVGSLMREFIIKQCNILENSVEG